MDRQAGHASRPHTPGTSLNSARRLRTSLILLESALISAQKLTPSRAPRPALDPDEALAARLVETIRHPQPVLFLALQIEPPQPSQRESICEMAGSDV